MPTEFTFVEAAELDVAEPPKQWIWEGYLAPGQITLFTSMWKSGKTTLLSHLLAQRKTGGALGGLALAAGLSAVVTEEPKSRWRERHAKLGIGPRNCFLYRPFKGVPSRAQWMDLIASLKKQHAARGIDLVVIDTLPYFLPAGEESSPRLLEVLEPLHMLTEQGQAVLLMHHPRKSRAAQGALARGSGILPSFADILIEMYRVRPDDASDRRRRLLAFSRDSATPHALVIELNEAGDFYTTVDHVPEDDEFLENWVPIRITLENAQGPMTRQEIRKAWPSSFPRPGGITLWRWLNQALQRRLAERTGEGIRAQPYRYFLPEKLAQWQATPESVSETPTVDAWMRRWEEHYPTPPEWEDDDFDKDGAAESDGQ